LKKNRIITIIVALLILIHPLTSFAETPIEIRDYKSPSFYSYTYFDGGNCVWFAWQMAYQKWGITLPNGDDARKWTRLEDRSILKDDWRYYLALETTPLVNSVVIFQPSDMRILAGGRFENDHYGHVAWIYKLSESNPNKFYVLESSVYPPDYWEEWHGCKWREYTYTVDELEKVKYLYINKIVNRDTDMIIEGVNPIIEEIEDNEYKVLNINEEVFKITPKEEKIALIQDADNKLNFTMQIASEDNPIEVDYSTDFIIKEKDNMIIIKYEDIEDKDQSISISGRVTDIVLE
jgi:surface antigen